MIDRNIDIHIEELDNIIPLKNISYIIFCHSSYEDRSLSIIDFSFSDKKIVNSIQISSKEYLGESCYIKNKNTLEKFSENISLNKPISVIADRDKPVDFLVSVDEALSSINDSYDGFIIDISTFPRDRLVCLLDYLMKIRTDDTSIEFIYTSPKKYSTESNDGWLTKGVRKISPIPRFNGKQKTRKKSLLIMLIGHEGERSQITLRNIEPDKLIIIAQGNSQSNNKTKEISNNENLQILNEHNILETIEAPYADPSSTNKILESLYSKYKDSYNIIVSINGTKLQVLGAMITCMRHREIQIIYTYPQIYNIESYSCSNSSSYYGAFLFS